MGGPIGGDSCGGNTQFESSIYHLAERDSITWEVCENFDGILAKPLVRFDNITLKNVFGKFLEVMQFDFGGATQNPKDTTWHYGASLAQGIGIIEEHFYEGDYNILQGAIINGVRYGSIVSVEDITKSIPKEVTLYQNYPNPFNPTTKIEYSITGRELVYLKIYNVLGQEVATLVNEEKPAGKYILTFDAGHLSSGVYFYQLKANNFIAAKKMIVLR